LSKKLEMQNSLLRAFQTATSKNEKRSQVCERESANLIDLFTLWSRIKKEILTKSSAEVHRLRNENFGTCKEFFIYERARYYEFNPYRISSKVAE
jgi:hypothetical protein